MIGSTIDAAHFVHLPRWAKLMCLAALAIGVLASLAITVMFFGSTDSRDWVVIGISGMQFLLTAFVVAVVLFLSETDTNIDTLHDQTATFLTRTLPEALARITLDEDRPAVLRAVVGDRRDIFGHDFALYRGDDLLLRLWCGVNVRRLIVIYRFVDLAPPAATPSDFVARLRTVFRFSFGGAESVGYNPPHFEPVVGRAGEVSVWLTTGLAADFLTNPTEKLFWAQDVAMMTESVLRTALRHHAELALDTRTAPRPQ